MQHVIQPLSKRCLGNTGIAVSRIALGTVKFGRNQHVKYPQPFTIPDDPALYELLALAKDWGVNVLDTAPAYGNSEERLGKYLRHQRDQWVICTKAGEEFNEGQSHFDFSAQAIRKSVERSLRRLQTDYLDIVLIHSNGDDERHVDEFHVFDTLLELKKAGYIRAFGMSTKTIEGGRLTVELGDVVMLTYNPIATQEKSVIDYAYQKNKGVLIKKALASGHLEKIAIVKETAIQTALSFILQEVGVTSVVVGTVNPYHLKQIIEITNDVARKSQDTIE